MNAAQRRKHCRRVWGDHFRWPLGMPVIVKPGHHSPAAVGLVGRVVKHGRPCTHRVDCIVQFPEVVPDMTCEGVARYGHYVKFRHLRKTKPTRSRRNA
ncbi:hypothetical protein [Variovorax sp. PMC12]|uniref:hypothetical protein n=1 Tax=Variovorax sp. PMC12 TaxID=2126319 RepID=UPI00131DEDFF|nr:hypothetical protein [Variovorax sp. PMC12]